MSHFNFGSFHSRDIRTRPQARMTLLFLLRLYLRLFLCTFKVMQAEETSKERVGVFSVQMCMAVCVCVRVL